MSKLSDLFKGHRAIKRIPLPLVNVPSTFSPEVPEAIAQRESDRAMAKASGEPAPDTIQVGLRVLTLEELATVLEKAGNFARERGVKEPNNSDPIYNLGVSIYTCALACVDPDSDPKDPDPFFGKRGDVESAALELLKSPHIGRDGIAYLAEQHETWQDYVNPQANKIHPKQMYDLVVALADKDESKGLQSFLALRLGMRWRLMLFMASLLISLPQFKSFFGASSPETSSNG